MTTDSDDFGAGENYITEGDVAADQEDLSDYKFSKFAATYFTASVMHSYLRFVSLTFSTTTLCVLILNLRFFIICND